MQETFASCIARANQYENIAIRLQDDCKAHGDTSKNLEIMRAFAWATSWRQKAAKYL
jgi:hypothetical protein